MALVKGGRRHGDGGVAQRKRKGLDQAGRVAWTYRLQHVSQKTARQVGSTFRHRILSFSDFRRHWWHASPGMR